MNEPVIIIGAGMAGYTVAREIRKLDRHLPLIVITADDGGFYSKPMLSNAFAQKKEAAQLVTRTAAEMAAQLGAHVLAGTRVHGIYPDAKHVATSAGLFDYSKLVIAIGAHPIRPSLEGNAANEVLSVNHISDYAAFRKRMAVERSEGARVVILGAGLIGCEFADDLADHAASVTLVDPNPLPLSALAAPALSLHLKNALSDKGVVLKLGTTATAVNRDSDCLKISLADGSTVDADIVLSAIGLRPEIALAQASGLRTGRGIIVDATGLTSAPDVYALGDCAEYTVNGNGGTRIMPYIAPTMSASRAIAATICGTTTAIDLTPTPVIVKTPSFPLALMPPSPERNLHGQWHSEMADGKVICRFYDQDGVLAGFGLSPHEPGTRTAMLAELEQARQPA